VYHWRAEKYPYPPMALCPFPWVNTTRALEMGMTVDMIRAALQFADSFDDFPNVTAARRDLFAFMKPRGYNNIISLFKDMALASDGRLTCKECANGSFFEVILSGRRMCYKIVVEPEYVALRKVENNFATVIFTLEDHARGLQGPPFLLLAIHEDWHSPLYDHVYFIPEGQRHSIYLKPERFVQTASTGCKSQGEVEAENYSLSFCRSDCFQRNFYRTCSGCMTAGHFRHDPGLWFQDYCIKDQTRDNCTVSKLTVAAECSSRCPIPCETRSYEVSISSRAQSVTTAPRDTRLFINLDIEDGIAVFEEVVVYTIDTLVSNLGGVLGLWLGGSMMTFVQIVFFVLGKLGPSNAVRDRNVDELEKYASQQKQIEALQREVARLAGERNQVPVKLNASLPGTLDLAE
jgi:Amiloride-sensitive sodium channel